MTSRNAPAIAQVCRRLDGIPLAIELAAARVRAMPVEQIAARLDDRFRLLTARTGLPRQRTLRAAMDWSYDLLSEPERLLMERLSAFAGGWTLEAAESVCASPPIEEPEILELLASVVEKSLVVYEERRPEARYRLLETVREYFRERRPEGGEAHATRRRHLEYFLALAEEGDAHLTDALQTEWLERLEAEHDNLRAALSHSTPDTPHSALGLRLAAALGHFWRARGYLTEGREWLAQALAGAAGATAPRARALTESGTLALRQGDYDAARASYEESLAIGRALGARSGIASSLNNLGMVAYAQEDYEATRAFYEESLAIRRELEDRWAIAASLNNLGTVAYALKDYETARSLYEESLAIRRDLGDRSGIAGSLNNLAMVAYAQGDRAATRSFYEECLPIRQELGDRWGIAGCLEGLAELACAGQGPEPADIAAAGRRAARLFGAAEALREAIGAPRLPQEREELRREVNRVRHMLGEPAFDEVWSEGRAMTLEQVIGHALRDAGAVE
jgi:non-specific serine/threonine protein kinase